MMKKPEKPDESELLAFLDEELTAERQAEIRGMLAANWELRAQLARLEKRIEQYVEATAQRTSIATPPVDDLWQDFSGRLSQTTTAPAASARLRSGLQSLTAKLTEWGRHNQPGALRLAIGAVVSLLLIVAFVLIKTGRTVSARELLERTAQAEAASLQRVGDPVVYRKIQVKRSGADEAVMWESWNDARRHQFRQRVADKEGLRFLRTTAQTTPPVLAELEQIFQANQLDAQRPLSATAYAEWRKTIRPQSESVVEIALPGQAPGLKLTTAVVTPVADHQIIEASFIVRRADWHAVALRLNVRSENEIRGYELSETAYEVLPLEALTVFADLAPTLALTPSIIATASPAAAPASVPAAAPSTRPLPTEAELKEAEVAALYALHQAQADLGEQIEVVREAGHGVIVRGLVERSERKQQLMQALNDIPHVTPRLLTIEEVVRQAQQKSGQSRGPENNGASGASIIAPNEVAVTTSAGATNANAFQQRLAESVGGRGPLNEAERLEVNRKVSRLYNAIEADASAALAEAWALRRLSDRFAHQTNADASPTARQRIDEMMGNHAARLKNRTRNLRARLEPLLVPLAGTSPVISSAPEDTRQARITAVFKAAEQISQ
ncbi:MAG: hypothetical protein ACREEM_27845, partial [Blastocatellia bacterium]